MSVCIEAMATSSKTKGRGKGKRAIAPLNPLGGRGCRRGSPQKPPPLSPEEDFKITYVGIAEKATRHDQYYDGKLR